MYMTNTSEDAVRIFACPWLDTILICGYGDGRDKLDENVLNPLLFFLKFFFQSQKKPKWGVEGTPLCGVRLLHMPSSASWNGPHLTRIQPQLSLCGGIRMKYPKSIQSITVAWSSEIHSWMVAMSRWSWGTSPSTTVGCTGAVFQWAEEKHLNSSAPSSWQWRTQVSLKRRRVIWVCGVEGWWLTSVCVLQVKTQVKTPGMEEASISD